MTPRANLKYPIPTRWDHISTSDEVYFKDMVQIEVGVGEDRVWNGWCFRVSVNGDASRIVSVKDLIKYIEKL